MKIKDLQQLASWMMDNSNRGVKLSSLTVSLDKDEIRELEDEFKDSISTTTDTKVKHNGLMTIKVYGVTFNIVEQNVVRS